MNRILPQQTVTEAVSPLHPDKVADRIADRLSQWWNPSLRSALEVLVKDDLVVVAGEVSGHEIRKGDVFDAVQFVYGEAFDWYVNRDLLNINVAVGVQSDDIAKAVGGTGAGDNGVMYGYYQGDRASKHFHLHEVLQRALEIRTEDGKRAFGGDGKAIWGATTDGSVVLNLHTADWWRGADSLDKIEDPDTLHCATKLKQATVDSFGDVTRVDLNPSGEFMMGGVWADAGVTGRKLMSDTYGTGIPHGGGAFSGKDLSKVDRSGAYLAHFLAWNIGIRLETEVLVQLSYVIGHRFPRLRIRTGPEWINDQILRNQVMSKNQVLLSRDGWVEMIAGLLTEEHHDIQGSHFYNPRAKQYPWSIGSEIPFVL